MACRLLLVILSCYGFVISGAVTSTAANASIQGTLTAQDGTAIRNVKITANFASPAKAAPGPTVTGLLQATALTAPRLPDKSTPATGLKPPRRSRSAPAKP